MATLIRDGAVIETFQSVNDALAKLHQMVPYSWDWAHKYEGWDVLDEAGESVFFRPLKYKEIRHVKRLDTYAQHTGMYASRDSLHWLDESGNRCSTQNPFIGR
jgi:hypothetical protein